MTFFQEQFEDWGYKVIIVALALTILGILGTLLG